MPAPVVEEGSSGREDDGIVEAGPEQLSRHEAYHGTSLVVWSKTGLEKSSKNRADKPAAPVHARPGTGGSSAVWSASLAQFPLIAFRAGGLSTIDGVVVEQVGVHFP